MVFDHMDADMNGRVTRTEFVGLMVKLGIAPAQSASLFNRIDVAGAGFIALKDWGTSDARLRGVIERLTLAYMRAYMSLPSATSSPQAVESYGRTFRAREVKDLPQALALARAYTLRKGPALRCGGESAIHAVFHFMDADGSGQLSRNELSDGFYAIGVPLHPCLLDELFAKFDRDGAGSIDYQEFLETLFPESR